MTCKRNVGHQNRKPCLVSRVFCYSVLPVLLGDGDVLCRRAFGTLFDFELHFIAFIQALVAGRCDRIEMNEHIVAACA